MLTRLLRKMNWIDRIGRWNRAEIEFVLVIIAGIGILVLVFRGYLSVC